MVTPRLNSPPEQRLRREAFVARCLCDIDTNCVSTSSFSLLCACISIRPLDCCYSIVFPSVDKHCQVLLNSTVSFTFANRCLVNEEWEKECWMIHNWSVCFCRGKQYGIALPILGPDFYTNRPCADVSIRRNGSSILKMTGKECNFFDKVARYTKKTGRAIVGSKLFYKAKT